MFGIKWAKRIGETHSKFIEESNFKKLFFCEAEFCGIKIPDFISEYVF